jgi:hypothetical protein
MIAIIGALLINMSAFAGDTVQAVIAEDLSSSKYLVAVLAKVPTQLTQFMSLGNEVTSVNSKTFVGSAYYTLENQNCTYGPEGQICKKAATLKITVIGQVVKAEVIPE